MDPLPYDEAGTGVPLLLIHGFPHDRRLWLPQLEGLGSTAHVIAPDLRGFGKSTPAPAGMTLEDHAADLKALLDHKGIVRAVICGLSMGGYIALAFVALYPESVRRLILCSTRAGADNAEALEGRKVMAQRIREEGAGPLAEAMLPRMLSSATRAEQPEVTANVRAMMAAQPPEGLVAALEAMAARPDRTALLASINVHTRMIVGSADTLIPPSESEAMGKLIRGSDVLVIPDAGHLPNVEAPAAFNGAVRGFLAGMK